MCPLDEETPPFPGSPPSKPAGPSPPSSCPPHCGHNRYCQDWAELRSYWVYWALHYWLLLLLSLYCGTTSPNHQSPPQAAGPGLPHCWLLRCGQNRNSVTRQDVLTFYSDQNQKKEQEEKFSQRILQRSTGRFYSILAANKLMNICFQQSEHDQ